MVNDESEKKEPFKYSERHKKPPVVPKLRVSTDSLETTRATQCSTAKFDSLKSPKTPRRLKLTPYFEFGPEKEKPNKPKR